MSPRKQCSIGLQRQTVNRSEASKGSSVVPEYAVVPALPSVDVAEELLAFAPKQRRRWGFTHSHDRCLVLPIDRTSQWKPREGCWIVQEPPLPPDSISRDDFHRPHFRSPPLITDLPGVLIRHASSDAECQARARAASFAATKAVQHLHPLKRTFESGISVHGLYVHQ